jgi:death-on-curing protein
LVVIDKFFSEYEKGCNKQFRGIKDTNLFVSALNQPKQTFDKKDLYPTILSKAACYLRSFSMDHPFFDGNKRTALMSTITFLEKNGYEVIADNEKMFKLVEKVVKGRMSVPSIERRLKKFTRPVVLRKRNMGFKEFLGYLYNKSSKK